MMQSANLVRIEGRLTSDLVEVNDGKIFKGSLAIDYASNDRENPTGFFDFVYFSGPTSNSEFVTNGVRNNTLKKGSSVAILGRLQQERWESKEGEKRNKVVVIAEHIDYSKGSRRSESDTQTDDQKPSAVTVPDAF